MAFSPSIDILPNVTRRQRWLVMSSLFLELVEDDGSRCGRPLGARTILRSRKEVEDMWSELGRDARKAFRMNLDTFHLLHDIL